MSILSEVLFCCFVVLVLKITEKFAVLTPEVFCCCFNNITIIIFATVAGISGWTFDFVGVTAIRQHGACGHLMARARDSRARYLAQML